MQTGVRVSACCALIGYVLLLVGCGPPGGYITYPDTGATLEGTITYGGNQVGSAMIIAFAEGSAPIIGWMGDDGRYRLGNVPIGEVRIGVNTAAAKGAAIGKAMAQAQGKAKSAPKIDDVPSKFGDPATSGLKTTVQKGPNTFDIVIPK